MNLEYTRAPHRAPDAAPTSTAALLIDFDNVTMAIRSNLGQEFRKLLDSQLIRGKVAVQRAYADWRRYPQYIVPLSEASIDLIFAPAYGSSKKNATDIRLAIDACELVFTRPEIGTFILLSGDSDFSSLVLKLKEYGKYVIGVGLQESASDILVQNCDEYYSYSQVSGLVHAGEATTEKQDPWVLVSTAIHRMAERGDVMRSDRLKQVMLEIDSSFDEKGSGFSKFNRFLAEAVHRDLIEMRKSENGQYEVTPGSRTAGEAGGEVAGAASATRAPARSSGSSGSSSSRSRRGGRGGRGGRSRSRSGGGGGGGGGSSQRSDEARRDPQDVAETPASPAAEASLEAAYDALVEVVADLYDGSAPVRDSMAKRKLLQRDSNFDEGKLGFPKFSRFLHQANEDGVVSLEQQDDGNFYLTPAKGKKRQRGGARAATATRSTQTPSASPPAGSESKPAARRGLLDRFLRGSRGKAQEASQATPDKPAAAPAPSAAMAEAPARREPEVRKQESRQDRQPRQDRKPQQERKPRSGQTPRSQQRPRAEQKPRGERQASAPKERPADRQSRPEPRRETKPEPTRQAEPTAEAASTADAASAEKSAQKPAEPAPRRLGRHRRGSRGRGPATSSGSSVASRIGPMPRTDQPEEQEKPKEEREVPAAPSESRAARSESRPEAKSAPSSESVGTAPTRGGPVPEAVEHMVRNYAGVGKRTAEVLVEHFGPKVFEVIDQEPGRLTEVLSEGRAKAVVVAREQERAG